MSIFKYIPFLFLVGCGGPSVYVRDFCILYQPVKLTDDEKFLLHTDRYDETNKPLVISIKRKIVTNNLIYEDTCK